MAGTVSQVPKSSKEFQSHRRESGNYRARIVSPERRARYWQDTALALHGRGRPRATFQALLAAERDTPQEVRFRPWAQQLTTDLLTRGHNLPGVREFANRVGVA
ncbi:hypothetical protein ACH4OY_05775 [Micromonospora rubida]|uniref:Integrase n=1 Tax=Micromonospora rubida TaxID=2697657 RepID=A0ABW7SEU1_9ACTN